MFYRCVVAILTIVGSASAQTLRQAATIDLPGPAGQRFDYLTMDDEDHFLLSAHLGPGILYVIDVRTNQLNGFGLVLEHPGARLYALNEEHGYLDLSECPDPPAIGDVVTIVPNHACVVSNLHDQVVVRQAGSPAAIWRVAARGLVR